MKHTISRRWIIFFAACMLFVLSQFYRASIAVITPDLIRDLGLDTRRLSLVSAAFFYTFAIMQIPIGMYLDAFGPLRFAALSALVLSFGTLGNMTAATPLALMVQSLGWRMTFIVFAGINLLLTTLFFAVVRDRPQEAPNGRVPPPVSAELREILANLRDLMT